MPSPVEKLLKFLSLEKDRGYDNRAVVGGLDKILPVWKTEAEATGIQPVEIEQISSLLSAYPQADANGRAEMIKQLIDTIQAIPGQDSAAVNSGESNSAELNPGQYREPAQPRRERKDPRPARQQNAGVIASSEKPAGLDAKLTVLPGIGPKNAQFLSQLGLNTLEDLLFFFPRRYDDYSHLKTINRLEYGDVLSVIGTIKSASLRPLKNGKMSMLEAIVTDGTGALRVTWFNQPWLEKTLRPGFQLVLSGKVEIYLGRLCMNNPDWEPIEQEHLHTNRIVPVYRLTGNITQRMLRRLMQQTISFWATRVPDYLPEDIRHQGQLIGLSEALNQAHFPDNENRLRAARERLAFDEIFLIQLGVLGQKLAWQSNQAERFDTPQEWLEQQFSHLPYELTNAQKRVIDEICADLASGRPMDRLLQGDVGSGKTLVAAMATAMVNRSGAQAAFMAPTSILAEQHFRSLSKLFLEDFGEDSVYQPGQIRLLVGDTPEAEKQEIRAGLNDGSIKLVIGTHALLEDPVTFQHLQLAIIDEQHRFGVSQRATLRAKGDNPHLLVMTATPIPRSLALTIYGDLDISVMDEMPPGRQPVETHILRPVERERAFSFIQKQVEEGHQAFIIYPLVEEGENEEVLAAVQQRDRLQNEIFPHLSIGLLHGKMKPDEKDQTMRDFRDGKYQILAATTVVEVGVDVPNATVIMIEGANRFGLAQLHQLRGRVGRGQAASSCILIPDKDDAVENERLKAMEETNDGFVLAERDLDQRGPGEFLGTRQAGFTDLRLASLTNVRLIEKARNLAQNLFAQDPQLSDPRNEALKERLQDFWHLGAGDLS
jgi:ATP-dependent DNA helicase RecG